MNEMTAKRGDSNENSNLTEISEYDSGLLEILFELKQDAICFMQWIDLRGGKKRDKFDKLVLCIGRYRVYMVKVGKKKAEFMNEAHYFNIQAIESAIETEMRIELKDFTVWEIFTQNTTKVINKIRSNMGSCFPGSVDEIINWKIDSSRLTKLHSFSKACGSFSEGYACLCDLEHQNGEPVREDIMWDIDNLFPINNILEFSFQEFELPISAVDIKTLLYSLSFNNYFKSLKLENDDTLRIEKHFASVSQIFKTNRTLTHLSVNNLEAATNDMILLFQNLKANKGNALTSIKFQNTPFDSQARIVSAISEWFTEINRGLEEIVLESTAISGKKFSVLFEAMRSNSVFSQTLSILSLCGNKLDKAGSESIATYLSQKNSLTNLDITNTNAYLPVIFEALTQGCGSIKTLKINGNKIPKKASEWQSIIKYFNNATGLSDLSMSNVEMSTNFCYSLMTALFGNSNIQSLNLIMKKNNLGKEGASQISRAISSADSKISCIYSWNLGSNELGDDGIILLTTAMKKMRKLSEVDLSYNWKTISKDKESKTREKCMNKIVDLLQSECGLKKLKMKGRRGYCLGSMLTILLLGLGSCSQTYLTSLDVSGNQSGDSGALAVSKSLQTNQTLTHLAMDKNNTTLRGFQWFTLGLERNTTLTNFSAPFNDVAQEKDEVLKKALLGQIRQIQKILDRNRHTYTHKSLKGNQSSLSLQLQQQQEEIKKSITKLESSGLLTSEVIKSIANDAIKFQELPPKLDELKAKTVYMFEPEIDSIVKEMKSKFQQIYQTMSQTMSEHLKGLIDKDCVCLETDIRNRLYAAIEFAQKSEGTEIQSILTNSTAQELRDQTTKVYSNINEMAYDYLLDKFNDSLQSIYDQVNDKSVKKNGNPKTKKREEKN